MTRRLCFLLLVGWGLMLNLDSARAEPWTVKGFVFGQVESAGPQFGFVDMGFGHRIKTFQEVAVFRMRNRTYFPVAVIRLERVEASRSLFRNSKHSPIKSEDLVVSMERDMVPIDSGTSIEEDFVRTNIIVRSQRNGHDSGLANRLAGTFRAQSHELRNRRSAAWTEDMRIVKVEVTKLQTDPKLALVEQLVQFRREVMLNPVCFTTLSFQWRQVLKWLEPKAEFQLMVPGVNDARIVRFTQAIRPELDDESAQLMRFQVARGAVGGVGQLEPFLKVSFLHSQFGTLKEDERLLKDLIGFIQEVAGQNSDAATN